MLHVKVLLLLVPALVVAAARITPAEQCPGEHHEELRERVHVIPCGKTRCKLRKGSNVTVQLQFRTTHEVAELKNNVWGEIAGVALHYPGVDQTTVCGQITHAEDDSPAPCPLQEGREYKYTRVFPIETYYPETTLRIHWSLHDGTANLICFEAPAVITK